jgi:hypothetical protein
MRLLLYAPALGFFFKKLWQTVAYSKPKERKIEQREEISGDGRRERHKQGNPALL